jgi:hypothetical protein
MPPPLQQHSTTQKSFRARGDVSAVVGGAIERIVREDQLREESKKRSAAEEGLLREVWAVQGRLAILEQAAKQDSEERERLKRGAEAAQREEASIAVMETIDFILQSIEESVSNQTRLTVEQWAKNEMMRLTAELDEERAARGALETRLAVLEKEINRDEREWQRTLRIGAALRSTASFDIAVGNGGNRMPSGESNLDESLEVGEAGESPLKAGGSGGSLKSKSKSKKNDGGRPGTPPPGALPLLESPRGIRVGAEGEGFAVAGLPAGSSTTPHLIGLFPARPAAAAAAAAAAALPGARARART